MTFTAPFSPVFYPVFGGAAEAEVLPWYLSGGIPLANCIAAWSPKGAASYAASKVDETGHGYTITEVVSNADWDTVNGWGNNGDANKRLDTGIVPGVNWSYIMLYSNESGGNALFGLYEDADTGVQILPARGGTNFYRNGGQLGNAGSQTGGVIAIADRNGYLDGSLEVSGIPAMVGAPTVNLYVLGRNHTTTLPITAKVQRFAMYDIDITSYIAALTAGIQLF